MKALWYARWLVKAMTLPILLLGAKWVANALGLRKRENQGQTSGLSLPGPENPVEHRSFLFNR